MVKIKITENEIEIRGTIEEGNVKPFGTSAHIPFMKKHTGKRVKIVIPYNTQLVWVLSVEAKAKALKVAEEYIIKEDGKLEHYRLGMLRNIRENDFNEDDLLKFIDCVINSGNKALGLKIKKIYNL